MHIYKKKKRKKKKKKLNLYVKCVNGKSYKRFAIVVLVCSIFTVLLVDFFLVNM